MSRTLSIEPKMDPVARKRARRNVILALVHVGLAIAVLIGFVIAQTHR